MATVVANHIRCYSSVSVGHQFSSTVKNSLVKKRIAPRKRVILHRGVRTQCRAALGGITRKLKKQVTQDDDDDDDDDDDNSTTVAKNLPGTAKLTGGSLQQPKDNKLIFVAGATGKVGSRTVRELLKLGFRVRASSRNIEKAEALFEDMLESTSDEADKEDTSPFAMFSPAKIFGFLKPKPGKALEIVECDLEDPETIEPALGSAGVVVCCIGASEKEIFDVTGPYRIDFKATQNLIDAASAANTNHFVLLTSLGTQKVGFPAAVLNLFWGVLIWKAKAEKALIQSQLPYTIVRPGGMERPTDAYKETHNLRLAEADKLFGGQVSNLQVAELIASIVENPDVSVNKIVEVVAETTAPLRPMRELLEEIPESAETSPSVEPTKKAAFSRKVGRTKALKEKDGRVSQPQKEVEKKKYDALRERYEREIEAAKEEEESAKTAADAALTERAELERKVVEIREKAEAAALAASQAKALEGAILAAARQGKLLSSDEKQEIMESVKAKMLENRSTQTSKESIKKVPAFSFFNRFLPSTTSPPSNETESLAKEKEEQEEAERAAQELEEQKAKAAAEAKEKEEQEKAEKEAKELKLQKAKAVAAAKEKEEQEKTEKEAKNLEEKKAKAAAEAKKKEDEEKAEKEGKELAQLKAKAAEETKRKEAEAERKEALAIEAANVQVQELEKIKEETAKQDAPSRKGFRWFWEPEEKPEPISELNVATVDANPLQTTPLSPYTGFPELKPPTSPIPSPPQQPEKIESGLQEQTAKEETNKTLPASSRPLSPYARYPGLKPPSSPIPKPPVQKRETATATAEKVDITSSDVKTPQKNETKEIVPDEDVSEKPKDDIEARKLLVQQIAQREKEALEKAKAATKFVWPWEQQISVEDQPKTSSAGNIELQEGLATASTDKESSSSTTESLPAASRPLSPYAQFPGLKPPSPPVPYLTVPNAVAPKDEKALKTLPSSSNPLSPYAGFPGLKPPSPPSSFRSTKESQNGAVPEEAVLEEEKVLEPLEPSLSSGFKWPWK